MTATLPDRLRCLCGLHLFATEHTVSPAAWARHAAHIRVFQQQTQQLIDAARRRGRDHVNDPDTRCADCSTETLSPEPGVRTEYYMLRDTVWAAARTDPHAYLCVGCIEARLGRRLHSGDFTATPINDLGIVDNPRFAWSWRSERLTGRLSR